jgi:hypothetical protein
MPQALGPARFGGGKDSRSVAFTFVEIACVDLLATLVDAAVHAG